MTKSLVAVLIVAIVPTAAFNVGSPRPMIKPDIGPVKQEAKSDTSKLLELRGGGIVSPEAFCSAMAMVYGGFGTLLATFPQTCFGGASPVSYWTTFGEAGTWFGRALGATMLFLYTSPYWAGLS